MEARVLLVETRALVVAAAEALVEIAKKLIGLHVGLAVVGVEVVDLVTAEVLEAKMRLKGKKMAQALVVEALEQKSVVDLEEVVVLKEVMMGKMEEVEAVDLEVVVTEGVEVVVVVHVTSVVKRAILLESVPKGVVVLATDVEKRVILLKIVPSLLTQIQVSCKYCNLLYRHECFTGKYTIRKIHKNYIRDPSGLFSIISHVSLSMT